MEVTEILYHTTLTVVDYHAETSGSTQTLYILGTHATIQAAKYFAGKALRSLGFEPEDFAVYEGHQPGCTWRHGDGAVVYAQAFDGRELIIGLRATPNNAHLRARPDGTLELPRGTHHLHYVVQNMVDYNQDRSGAVQVADIEGCFLRREDAVQAARLCLAQTGLEFAEYDERQSLGWNEEWPFGEDVLVHAIAQTGENFTVAVRSPPEAHRKHGKNLRGRLYAYSSPMI